MCFPDKGTSLWQLLQDRGVGEGALGLPLHPEGTGLCGTQAPGDGPEGTMRLPLFQEATQEHSVFCTPGSKERSFQNVLLVLTLLTW